MKKRSDLLFTIFLTVASIFVSYQVFTVIDGSQYGHHCELKLLTGKDCAYQIPPHFSLAKETATGRYAIKNDQYADYYLYQPYTRKPTLMFSSIGMPATFDDSCQAKQYLEDYIKSKEPEFK